MSGTWIVDIETDGLLRPQRDKSEMTQVWCGVARDLEGEHRVFHDAVEIAEDGWHSVEIDRDGSLSDLVALIDDADLVIGHGLQSFDLPALRRVMPGKFRAAKIYDTLVASRLIFPAIADVDKRHLKRTPPYPPKLIGSHSLEAWGHRLGHHKGEWSDFSRFSEGMLEYCVQDTAVTLELYKLLLSQKWPESSLELEHPFAKHISDMQDRGVVFDVPSAEALASHMALKKAEVGQRLRAELGSFTKSWTTPKKKLKRTKVVQVNPSSRVQVADALKSLYGWVPKEFTKTGRPTMSDDVLDNMDPEKIPVAEDMRTYFSVEKALGRLKSKQKDPNKDKSLLGNAIKVGDHHRIHSFTNHNGARTGRCTHRIVANIPRVTSPWGREMRSLFMATPGMVLVGADMAGAEGRLAAHYLTPIDKGAFTERILSSDIHTSNQEAADLPSRNVAKHPFYAILYGAGPEKVGETVIRIARQEGIRIPLPSGGVEQLGGRVRRSILANIPGLEEMIAKVEEKLEERGYLIGLDGRRITPAKERKGWGNWVWKSPTNCLIQSAGGVVMKQATVLLHAMVNYGHHGKPWGMVIHYHDEYQCETEEEWAPYLGDCMVSSIVKAGEILDLRCPLDADYKVGQTWAETH